MPRPKSGRYGQEVLSSPYGRYFWSETLMDINFLPPGVHRSRDSYNLMPKHNTLEHAVRFAAKMAERHAMAVLEGRGNFADWPIHN